MPRPNLFMSISLRAAVLLGCIAALPAATAQQYYGPPQYVDYSGGGGYLSSGQCQPPQMHIPRSHYQAPIVDYYQGVKPALWDDEQPVERFLTALGRRSWMRFEYLHWNFERVGSEGIGAPVIGVRDLSQSFEVFDNLNGGITAGQGIIPSAGGLSVSDISGVRGTWGLALNGASMELEFFGTEETGDTLELNNLSGFRATGAEALGTTARPNVITPLLTNGAATDTTSLNSIVYDSSFFAEVKGQMWGSELSFLTNPSGAGEGVWWQWLGGFRYVNYDESFSTRGVYNAGGTLTDRVTRIGGSTVNNMYGPEVGARLSLNHRWFNLSATPRIAFTLNDYTAHTVTGPLTTGTEPATRITDEDIEFTPLVQLSFKGEVHVTPNFSLFGGYDWIWIYRMTRPHDNIVYDSEPGAAGGFNALIGQQVDLESFYTHGLSAGAVLRY